jgi:hypothetical protein
VFKWGVKAGIVGLKAEPPSSLRVMITTLNPLKTIPVLGACLPSIIT